MDLNQKLLALATKLAALADGLGNGNSSAEEQATRLAEEAKLLIAPMTAPEPGEIWQHPNGRKYRVLFITNTAHRNSAHPPQVVYQGVHNDNKWSRSLPNWHERMTFVEAAPPRNQ